MFGRAPRKYGKVWPSGAEAYSFISLVELVIGAVQKHSFVCYTPCGKNEQVQEDTIAKFLVTYHGAGMPHDPAHVAQAKAAFQQWLSEQGTPSLIQAIRSTWSPRSPRDPNGSG